MTLRRITLCVALATGCGDDPKATELIAESFEWGTATAAYQIEGGNTTSDFYQWEQACVRGPNDAKKEATETVKNCDSNLDGPDFLNHYEADFDAAKGMSHNAFRMGIEWSKIEPTQGTYDTVMLAQYHAIIDAARARGLSVMVTLQHFTLPIWVSNYQVPEDGLYGWAGPDGSAAGEAPIIGAFEAFAGDMAEEFGGKVDLWVTINEPVVLLLASYLGGEFAPGERLKAQKAVRAAHNMAYAHARAYDVIHTRDLVDVDDNDRAAEVSLAQHWRIFDPFDPDDEADHAAAAQLDYVFNRLVVNAVTHGTRDLNGDGDSDDANEGHDPALAGRMDWLGINYYGRQLVQAPLIDVCDDGSCAEGEGVPLTIFFQENPDPAAPKNDLGWEIYPEGLTRVLAVAKTYDLPIRITENGMADHDDDLRPAFIVSHLSAMQHAMHDGAKILGYYHWSLIDNFEWAEGFEPRFGLLHVDYTTTERTRTKTRAADAFSAIIRARDVTKDIAKTYGTIP